jgi:hypothetical protein
VDDDILKGIRRIRPQAEIGLESGIGGAGGPSLSGVLANAVRHTPVDLNAEMMKAYKNKWEMVPVPWLEKVPGNTLRNPIDELRDDIAKNGLQSPLTLSVGKESRTAELGEGNHRLAAIRELGYTHAPTRTVVGRNWGSQKGYNVDEDLIPRAGEYFSADARPSDVFRSLAGAPPSGGKPQAPLDVTPKPTPLGDCFKVSYRQSMAEGGDVVHGLVTNNGKTFEHAWVEKDGQVIDRANGNNITMPAADYYANAGVHPDKVRRYAPDEARITAVRSRHFGPW